MNPDPLFRTPSDISRGTANTNPLTPVDATLTRSEAISEAAYAVRRALADSYGRAHDEAFALLPLDEQTRLLTAAFCNRPATLAPYVCRELSDALAAFRALVPLVPLNALDRPATAPVSVKPGEFREVLQRLHSRDLTPEEAAAHVRRLAEQSALPMPSADLGAAVDELETSLAQISRQGTRLLEYAEGTEARVYRDTVENTVYKAVPFRANMMQIPPILDEAPLTASNDHGTFMADPWGGMPLFDRARLMAATPGVCRTELVALTSGGVAVYKQPFLGDREATMAQIAAWAQQYGHAPLPGQTVDGPAGDVAQFPFVAASPTKGRYVVGLDLNPRNARAWNGWCIPFDPVLRELDRTEIASHPALQAAIDSLSIGKPNQGVSGIEI